MQRKKPFFLKGEYYILDMGPFNGCPLSLLALPPSLINLFVAAYIDQTYRLLADDQFKGDPVADIDGNAMQTFEFAFEGMQAE
jgi:hypothetical protein